MKVHRVRSHRGGILALSFLFSLISGIADLCGQEERGSIERIRERVDTLLEEKLRRGLYPADEDRKEKEAPLSYDTLPKCSFRDSALCLLAEWRYPKTMIAVDLYRGRFRDGKGAQYLAVVNIGAVRSWSNFLIFFSDREGTLRRVSIKDVPAKGNLERVSFHRLHGGSERYSVLAHYRKGVSTYVQDGSHLFQWNGDEVRTVFDTVTFYYDWKHYGKRFHELGYQDDSIADDEAYREKRRIRFSDTNEDGRKEIVLNSQKAIVERLDRKDYDFRDFPVKKVLEEERSVHYWDPNAGRYQQR